MADNLKSEYSNCPMGSSKTRARFVLASNALPHTKRDIAIFLSEVDSVGLRQFHEYISWIVEVLRGGSDEIKDAYEWFREN